MKQLEGMAIRASDGEIGSVKEFYFDDEKWTVRYLVAETSTWFGRPVLISPISLAAVDVEGKTIGVTLTREQVKDSPSVDLHRPISRQFEDRYSSYYGYLPYWGGAGYWGVGATPGALSGAQALQDQEILQSPPPDQDDGPDSHLHSSAEVFGYHIDATDGEIGHIDDFIVDDENWVIRYMRVDTSNFIGGKAVLVSAAALAGVDWLHRTVSVNVSREAVTNSPEYDPKQLNREFETRLLGHYGQRPYWH